MYQIKRLVTMYSGSRIVFENEDILFNFELENVFGNLKDFQKELGDIPFEEFIRVMNNVERGSTYIGYLTVKATTYTPRKISDESIMVRYVISKPETEIEDEDDEYI